MKTFTPACALTFTALQRNADNKNAFGWYNVNGAAPTNSQLHEVLACGDAVGVAKTVEPLIATVPVAIVPAAMVEPVMEVAAAELV